MTSNNNNDDNIVIQMNLTSWCRWKALYYKDKGSLSASIKEEGKYLETLPIYKQRWIIDGEGTPLAPINDAIIIKAALKELIKDYGELETIKLIRSDSNDFKFYADYCYDYLEHN